MAVFVSTCLITILRYLAAHTHSSHFLHFFCRCSCCTFILRTVISDAVKMAAASGGKLEIKISSVPDRHLLPQGNTLMTIFGPWLIEACNSTDITFLDGRASAYEALCHIFCTRCAHSYEEMFLSAFYQVLYQIMPTADTFSAVSGEICAHS